jgi:hypothetical protein
MMSYEKILMDKQGLSMVASLLMVSLLMGITM